MIAHAFGQRFDSPVPLALFVLGGAVVVLLSFALVYRRAVADGPQEAGEDVVVPPRAGRIASGRPSLVLALLVLAGLLGSQEVPENILPTAFWLVAWVAVPLSVGVLGDWTGPGEPVRRDHPRRRNDPACAAWCSAAPNRCAWSPRARLVDRGGRLRARRVGELIVNGVATLPARHRGRRWSPTHCCARPGAPRRRGRLERAVRRCSPSSSRPGAGWVGGGSAPPGGAASAGGSTCRSRHHPAASSASCCSWCRSRSTACCRRRNGAGSRAACPTGWAPGSHGYEALRHPGLRRAHARHARRVRRRSPWAPAARPDAGSDVVRALTGLLPSLLPIAFGYLLAHYLQYVLINGQLLLPLLGNPVGSESWPLHLPYPFNDDYEVATGVMPTSVVWYVQIVVIVAAHVVAVVLAHRHLARQAGARARGPAFGVAVAGRHGRVHDAQPVAARPAADGAAVAAPARREPPAV